MPGWMTVKEAGRFFGIGDDLEELERICVEYDIDVDLDGEGNVTAVNAHEVREALFEEHKKKVGYRPDDPTKVKAARASHARRERDAKARRKAKRAKLHARVAARAKKKPPKE